MLAGFRDYLILRIGLAVPALFGMTIITFLVSSAVPGDPVLAWLGTSAARNPEAYRLMRERLGLDKPLPEQYFAYLWRLLHGDFGNSIVTQRPVLADLLHYFPATLELSNVALIMCLVIGVPLGIVAATHRNRIPDYVARILAVLGCSIPQFLLGLILLFVFYHMLGWVGPGRISSGVTSPPSITGFLTLDSMMAGNLAAFSDSIKHLLLPAFTMALLNIGVITRIVRSTMIDVLNQDFIRALRAKGLAERVVIYRHALKNSFIPTVTVVGLAYGWLLAGSVLAEVIFAWPGIGRYAVKGMMGIDFPAIMGAVLLMATNFIIVNLLVDLAYGYLDPRIRYA